MQAEALKKLVIAALEDLKAVDLVTIDVGTITSITDVMIICSGGSTRHVKSLASNVVKMAKEQHLSYIRMEGDREGDWVIVDLADVIIHVMLPASRKFYNLEDLWEPIKLLREKRS